MMLFSRRKWLLLPYTTVLAKNTCRHHTARQPEQPSQKVMAPASPPQQAIAAGYSHPALLEEFNNQSVSPDNTGVFNWYSHNPYGGSLLTPRQWHIANSCLTIETDVSGYSSGVTSTNSLTPTLSKLGAIAANAGHGRTFQFGYFECSMQFDPSLAPQISKRTAWPSWWSNAIQGPQNINTTYAEIDFMEAYPIASSPYVAMCTTIHEWTRGVRATGVPNGNNQNVQNADNRLGVPAIVNLNDFNTYGFLWTPTSVKWYINNQLITTAGIGPGTKYPSAAMDQIYLVLGAGVNWPVTIDSVHVWQ